MKNRLFALLILIIFFGGIFGFYYYFFVLNKGNLTITSNVGGYEVSLYNNDLKTTFRSSCQKDVCELIDIAPFSYTMTITKDGYKTVEKNIQLEKKGTIKENIYLEKELKITKIQEISNTGSLLSSDDTGTISEESKLTAKEKIDQIKKLKDLQEKYKFYNLGDLGYFYFDENKDNTLTLFREKNGTTTNIYKIQKADKDLIDLYKIENSLDFLLLKLDKKVYIFDLLNGKTYDFDFGPKINYVKIDTNVISIVCDIGTYLFDLNTEKLDYFTFFKDFLYYKDDSYFGIIYSDEIDKKKNYNLNDYSQNLIVKYNFKTKEIKVLKTTDIDIKKILKEGTDMYFYDGNSGKYLIDNVD